MDFAAPIFREKKYEHACFQTPSTFLTFAFRQRADSLSILVHVPYFDQLKVAIGNLLSANEALKSTTTVHSQHAMIDESTIVSSADPVNKRHHCDVYNNT